MYKFRINGKWMICCLWDNSQDFDNFEESLCQVKLFDTKNLNLLLRWCIYPNILAVNFFFHNLFCWRYEGFKDLVPHSCQKKCGHIHFRDVLSSASQIMKEKIYCQNIGEEIPFQHQIRVFVSNNIFGTGTLQNCQNFNHCSVIYR